MSDVDKTTIKTRAYPDGTKSAAVQNNLTPDQEKSLEFVKKNARLEEENKKLLEQLATVDQLQASLRQEQAKTAETAKKIVGLESKIKELAELEAKAQNTSELEAKVKKVAELEVKVKELTEALGKISGIAAGKAG